MAKERLYSMTKNNILLVEDSREIQLVIKNTLGNKFNTSCASTIDEAKKLLSSQEFQLILLDIGLPDGDGFTFCKELKSNNSYSQIPITFLTGKREPLDKVLGFSVGAEDYIVKPIEPLEFCARIESKLRIANERLQKEDIFTKGPFRISYSQQKLFASDNNNQEQAINLTTMEFRLFGYLLKNEEHVLSRDQILDKVWGNDANVTDRTIDTHIYTLRKKLGKLGKCVKSIPKVGYTINLKALLSQDVA